MRFLKMHRRFWWKKDSSFRCLFCWNGMVFKLPRCSLDCGLSPFWLDWLGEGLQHASQPLIRPDQTVESISQRFLSPIWSSNHPTRQKRRRLIPDPEWMEWLNHKSVEWRGMDCLLSATRSMENGWLRLCPEWRGQVRGIPFEVTLMHHLQNFSGSWVFREKVPSINIMIGSTRPDHKRNIMIGSTRSW